MITITGLHLPRNSENTPILTLFDVRLEGLMHLRGCALVDKPAGLTVWGPPLPKGETVKSGIAFSKELRTAITEAASAAYEALKTAPRPGFELSAAVALVRQIEEREA
ncbi:hypothetical protein U0030_15975 [Brevundimonas bullata]|uniref:hypothetical protein n=1 Tax=Brevundimonas bullata TaxID=13160 RepID=UPI000E0C702F|nr:hypothetical protein [Brevundimonas bullata]WQE36736.1 hypothetical protein U0030_15975 [Brevundimonas bullata]